VVGVWQRAWLVACLTLLAACGGAAPEADVEVGLTEMAIWADGDVPAGTSVWQVTNSGEAHHNLTICEGDVGACEGPNVDQRVLEHEPTARDQDALPDVTDALVLGAGWTNLIEVELAPGTYRLWCAVPNHAVKGMDTTVEVG
jgi:uncharacterized cupredoxin-like copper-binding protein